MKAVILARVSTAEQREAGNSLPSQLFRLEKYVRDHDWEVFHRCEFDESAYKTKREEFARVIRLIRDHREPLAVCCDKVDRLVRNFTKDLVTLEEWRREGKIELHFPSDGLVLHKDSPATDLFRFTMGVSLAKYYSDSIRDNVRRAFEQKLRNGEWIGPPRLGYMLVRDENGRRDHVPDPHKAHLIAQIFELYATGSSSIKTVKQKMANAGLVGKGGKPLSQSMVAHVLRDTFYCGVMVSRGVEYPHRYRPLIDGRLFERCQEVRLSWSKKPFKYAGKPFIFRGLLRCALCGCTMTPEIKKQKYIFYSCTNARGMCQRVYVPERILLEPIYQILRDIQVPPGKSQELVEGLRAVDQEKSDFHQREVARLQQEYERLQNRIDGLPALLLDGAIARDVYQTKLREWKQAQYDASVRLEAYTRADEGYLVTVSAVLDWAARASDLFKSSEVGEKRQFLAYLLQNPQVDGKKLTFELKSPFDTIAAIRNRPIGLPVLDTFRTLDWGEIRRNLEKVSSLFPSTA